MKQRQNESVYFNVNLAFLFVPAIMALAISDVLAAVPKDKITTTPALIQNRFGPGGENLPGDGLQYCAPTSNSSSLMWMDHNGFDRLYEEPYETGFENQENLIRTIAGLANTSAQKGSLPNGMAQGLEKYFKLKGYDKFTVTIDNVFDGSNQPDQFTLSSLEKKNQGFSYVNLWVYWVTEENGIFKQVGGHAMSLLEADPSTGTLHINNPQPWPLPVPQQPGVNPERFQTNRFDQNVVGMPEGSYLNLDLSNVTDNGYALLGVTLNIKANTNDPTTTKVASPWTITSNEIINTNGSYLTVKAPIQGSGGLIKLDTGDQDGILVLEENVGGLEDPYTFTGGIQLINGVLELQETSKNPAGTGAVNFAGGILHVAPAGKNENLSLSLAGGANDFFSYSGGGTLFLDKGKHKSLTLTIGGHTDGVTPNLRRGSVGTLGDFGTMVVMPEAGLSALGETERLMVAGSEKNLPTLIQGMLSPALIVAGSEGEEITGSFSTYDLDKGFLPFSGTLASSTSLDNWNANTVLEVDQNQNVNEPSSLFALRIDNGIVVSGDDAVALSLGNPSLTSESGLILDGGKLTVPELDIGMSLMHVYTGSQNGTIASQISAVEGADAGGLLVFGPGKLSLQGESTYAGGTLVLDGSLSIENSSAIGSATGSGNVLVTRNGQLSGTGRIGGSVISGGIVTPGSANNNGTVTTNGKDQILQIAGDFNFQQNSILNWNLINIKDDDDGGVWGTDWTGLTVDGALAFGQDSVLKLHFPEAKDLLSGDPYWTQNRKWSFINFGDLPQYDQGGLTALQNSLAIFGKGVNFGNFKLDVVENVVDGKGGAIKLIYITKVNDSSVVVESGRTSTLQVPDNSTAYLPEVVYGQGNLDLSSDGKGTFILQHPTTLTGTFSIGPGVNLEIYTVNAISSLAAINLQAGSQLNLNATDAFANRDTLEIPDDVQVNINVTDAMEQTGSYHLNGPDSRLVVNNALQVFEGGVTETGGLSGNGFFRGTGGAWVYLLGEHDAFSGQAIMEDTASLNLSGTFGDSSTQVATLEMQSGTQLQGSGTLLGTVTLKSGSVHAPGNSVGSQTFTNYVLNDGATLEIEFDRDSAGRLINDQVIFTNSATLGSGTGAPNISVSLLAEDIFFQGEDRYQILKAETGASLDVRSTPIVTDSPEIPLVSFSPDKNNDDDLELRSNRQAYASLPGAGLNLNQTEVASALDHLVTFTPTGTQSDTSRLLLNVDPLGQAVLDAESGAVSGYQQALRQLSGEQFFSVSRSQIRETSLWGDRLEKQLEPTWASAGSPAVSLAQASPESLMQTAMQGASRADGTRAPGGSHETAQATWRANVDVYGARLSSNTYDAQSGYNSDVYGLSINADHPVTEEIRLGGVFGYANQRTNFDDFGGYADIETLRTGVTAVYEPSPRFSLVAAATIGFSNIDTERPIALLDETAKGQTKGRETLLQASGTYQLKTGEHWRLDALGGLRWIDQNIDGFSESGAGAASLQKINGRTNRQLESTLGARWSMTFEKGQNQWTPGVYLAWRHLLHSEESLLNASFNAQDPQGAFFSLTPNSLDKDAALVGLWLDAKIKDSLSLYASYSGSFSSHNQEQALGAGLHWRF